MLIKHYVNVFAGWSFPFLLHFYSLYISITSLDSFVKAFPSLCSDALCTLITLFLYSRNNTNKQNEQELDQIGQERSASWIWETGMRDMGGGHIKVAFNVLEHPDFKDTRVSAAFGRQNPS